MLAVRVSRWSQAAARLIHPQQVLIGRVHSCYARIINVQTPAGRLLTLQGQGRLQAPLALALARDIEALGVHLPLGVLVVQDIPAAGDYPAALRGSQGVGWVFADLCALDLTCPGTYSHYSGCLALPPCPEAWPGTAPGGSGD